MVLILTEDRSQGCSVEEDRNYVFSKFDRPAPLSLHFGRRLARLLQKTTIASAS